MESSIDTEQPPAERCRISDRVRGHPVAIVGALFVWVLNQKMTWARAPFASIVTWIKLVIFFGIVPSEWLNYAQTDLDWSGQAGRGHDPTGPGAGQRRPDQLGCDQGLHLDGLSPRDAGVAAVSPCSSRR